MEVQLLNSQLVNSNPGNQTSKAMQGAGQENGFGTYLKKALNEVNNLQLESDVATKKLAAGEKIELHEVMIASQKASVSMQAALEIRNKAVEAYQEIMRMQV
ncbi:flagellar hook-basal body complex protein FliE [Bacillus thermophilus]|jgi:flagellar hook-basal body complex protein FliE|uniref:Flagellar hook-basal body complex protein FliE n=2 Tax=Siminovitchia TaxID=2837510 RepID=A0ABS2R9Y3_9BACI|nr:flagellar hook-basal body complex protein FliE [Siminovitchia thermophila]MBM7716483.1 flagellar hook-basal body complex protein FliE [Siminovitchia thermophila]ONK23243.1 flagellar hook-basal body complex protein FliE [Bacillus sp. VT-16-64]